MRAFERVHGPTLDLNTPIAIHSQRLRASTAKSLQQIIREVNKILNRFGCTAKIQTVRSKYLNNLIEQDHRFIKRRIRHMCGFKSFRSASATLDGIEVAKMIRKQQFPSTTTSGFRQFAEIAG
ncbi:DDE-type integrase/transposase/recombinase [Ruegeria conchae]|uniref:DDE-type integrase/transposase/recombinase n=1 Tax=Ruegeria conchae TaxID=981384 RepID=UPI003983ECE2